MLLKNIHLLIMLINVLIAINTSAIQITNKNEQEIKNNFIQKYLLYHNINYFIYFYCDNEFNIQCMNKHILNIQKVIQI